jgi:hypothetical protein
MANTHVLISSVTVGAAGAASIDFTSIPGTYTDLQVVVSAFSSFGSYGTDRLAIRFNSDTSTNYSWKQLQGFGSFGVTTASYTSQTNIWIGVICDAANNNAFSSTSVYIPNYASSSQKYISSDSVGESNQAPELCELVAGVWTGTSAITSISIYPPNTTYYNLGQYSIASLYGIKNS